MRSIRGLLAAVILLLTVPLALVVAIATGGGAEPIVHFGIGAGMVLLAAAAFDYDLPRPMAWFGAVTTGAFGAIFLFQGIADALGNLGLWELAFHVLGQLPERVLPDLIVAWFVALVVVGSAGRSRILGMIMIGTLIVAEVATLAGPLAGVVVPDIKLRWLLPFVWLLVESAKPAAKGPGRGLDLETRLPAPHRPDGGRGVMAQTGGRHQFRSWIHRAIVRHPMSAYLLIAFGWAWALTPLVSTSVLFGLVALFGPAVAAIVVSRADGSAGELRARIIDRRGSPRTYLLAVGIPFGIAAVALAAWLVSGHARPGFGAVSAIELLIFVLVIGEEIGWRGFLLPRLRDRMSLPVAGLVTGIIWAAWHLPIYLAPGQGLAAFAVFAWWVLPLAVVMAYVAQSARYAVLVATVMHGAANTATVVLLPGVDHTWTMLASGTAYLFLAITLIVRSRSRSGARSPQFSASPVHTKEAAA